MASLLLRADHRPRHSRQPESPASAIRTNCTFYEVTVTEGPKYPGPKRRDLIFGCKFNPHRNTHRFLKALFARIARADSPDPKPDDEA